MVDLYQQAVAIAPTLKIKWHEGLHENINGWRYLVGISQCPCGNMEQVAANFTNNKNDHRMMLALHHAWHHACFKNGLDIETPFDVDKLEIAGINAGLKGRI